MTRVKGIRYRKILHKIERAFGISIAHRSQAPFLSLSPPSSSITADSVVLLCSPLPFSLLLRLSFLPSSSLRLRSWQWRPLINFSRWLALFVRRYGIFPLRFSNRSSILNPSDSSSSSTSPARSVSLSQAHRLAPSSPSSTACFPLRTRVCVGSRLGGTNGGEYEREREKENAENEEKDGDGLFLFQERSFEYEYALIDS